MKLLLSNPRYGSTFASRYFQAYNEKTMEAETLPELYCEYLSPKLFPIPIEEKIERIEQARKNGRELLFQVHAPHLFHPYKDGLILDWFNEFYKDAEIYKLCRKDLWRPFLSLFVHHFRKKQKTSWLNPWHNDSDNATKNIMKYINDTEFVFEQHFVDRFFEQYEMLNSIEGEVLYLEENDHESFNRMLGVDIPEIIKPWKIDYEGCIPEKTLLHLEHAFQEKINTLKMRKQS